MHIVPKSMIKVTRECSNLFGYPFRPIKAKIYARQGFKFTVRLVITLKVIVILAIFMKISEWPGIVSLSIIKGGVWSK